MNDEERSTQNGGIHWLLILISALVAIWLWVSWLRGWFPFSSQTTNTSEGAIQQVPQSVLDSLTAPTDSPVNEVPQSVLDSLTAPKSSTPY